MAGSVVVTVGEAHDRLMPALREATEELRVGDGIEEGVDVGPVVSATARDRIRDWIDRGVSEGATLAVDGRDVDGDGLPADGSYVGPTILDDVTPEMAVGPGGDLRPGAHRRSTWARSTRRSTSSTPAASATACRSSPSPAPSVRRFRHEVEVGMIGVNIGVAAPVAFFPFSGWKDSFLGDLHAHGPDAVEFYTRKKTVTSRWFSSGQGHGQYFVEK